MRFIDTHSHLYLNQFDEDRAEVVSRAKESGVDKILLPNIEKDTFESMMSMVVDYPGYCYSMIGLHPCSVGSGLSAELKFIEDQLSSDHAHIAIGEIGLDYYWDTSFKDDQINAFMQQLDWAKDLDLPVAIHCRESMEDILKVIREMQDGRLRGVLHCFTGTVDDGKELVDLGMHLGLGGVITFKNGGMDKVIPFLPLDRFLLETDSPYLTPTPHRGKRNESAYIPIIAERLSDLTDSSVDEIANQTSQNAQSLFGI